MTSIEPRRVPAILAIGRNYAEHAREMGASAPEAPPPHPMVFMKNPAAIIGDGETIIIPRCCADPDSGGPEQVDYEGELAVIIGRACRDATERSALGFVGGYAAANDVSARWWQRHGSGGQFCRGKSFDTFCPIGPVKPAGEVADPSTLRIVVRLGTEVVQEDSTANMLFPVPRLIAELSRGTTLLPGTVILTGTPAGVGSARKPPRWLRAGDVVEVAIEGVGRVRNSVAAEAG
ncbi:MAG TPA: fumarylacetoacetate hydrolase family protein [Phycisphaerales bacterium]|nr:fumarylacetoacetate hydrolase family protein [Phycisphaerales bacterium]HMP38382.1 fumarylacetoacetate hydrolase family protein [Phycisphaerales bacterium]